MIFPNNSRLVKSHFQCPPLHFCTNSPTCFLLCSQGQFKLSIVKKEVKPFRKHKKFHHHNKFHSSLVHCHAIVSVINIDPPSHTHTHTNFTDIRMHKQSIAPMHTSERLFQIPLGILAIWQKLAFCLHFWANFFQVAKPCKVTQLLTWLVSPTAEVTGARPSARR